MRDLDYIFAVARIRVKEKSLLSDADIRQMADMKDNQEILNFLSERGWGTGDAAQDGESMLDAEEKKLPALMHELKVDPKLFQILSYPRLYHNLKAGIKEVCTSDAAGHLYYDIDGFGREDVRRILREKDFRALPLHMREVAQRAYKVMLQTRDGQKCDVMIDRACLDACEAAGRKSGNALMQRYQESTVAVTDIRIAVRAQKTGKDLKFLQEALAPCDSLNVDTLAAAAAGDEKTLMEYLEGTGFRDAAEALKESAAAFEKWCDDQVILAIMPQKMNSVSAGPVIAYYLARENEIKMVRILLTAKANGFSQENIRERLRKMYG
ncbi:MAG: V-type ATPase subunit [Eubacterium sp.]|nr:V-type ATPase subunit [Eubacterium sp.]